MAMSKTTLRDLIKSKVEAKTGNTMPSQALDVWEAVADAIITHVQAAADVDITLIAADGYVAVGAGAVTGTKSVGIT